MANDSDTPVCNHCGTKFTPIRFWQRFCSGSCKSDYHRQRRIDAFKALKEKEDNI